MRLSVYLIPTLLAISNKPFANDSVTIGRDINAAHDFMICKSLLSAVNNVCKNFHRVSKSF